MTFEEILEEEFELHDLDSLREKEERKGYDELFGISVVRESPNI